jgi:hypothetical protein
MRKQNVELHNKNVALQRQVTLLQNHCKTLETLRRIETLNATNFENFLVRNHYRLVFLDGQIHFPVYSHPGVKVSSAGRFARQMG